MFQPGRALLDREDAGKYHRCGDGYLEIELFVENDPSQEQRDDGIDVGVDGFWIFPKTDRVSASTNAERFIILSH